MPTDGDRIDRDSTPEANDLELIASSFGTLSDVKFFDRMVEAWDRKLRHAEREGIAEPIDPGLAEHLSSIKELLDRDMPQAPSDPVQAALDELGTEAMVLSPDGTVAAVAHGGGAFFRVAQGRAAGLDWLAEASLSEFRSVSRTLLGQGNRDHALLQLADPDYPGRERLGEAFLLSDGDHSQMLVVRVIETRWEDDVSLQIGQAFGLTDAELDVARLTYMWRDLRNVAEQRGTSLDTVKTQIKSILAKTDLHSQGELIRLLSLLCIRSAATRPKTTSQWRDPTGSEVLIERADGRRLAYNVTGAANGRTVIFLHGFFPHYLFATQFAEELERLDCRFIGLTLPGRGNSDPTVGEDNSGDCVAALRELIEHLDVGPVAFVGFYGGILHALNFAIAHPQRVSGLLAFGFPWFTTETRFRRTPAVYRSPVMLARFAPAMLDVYLKMGKMLVGKHGQKFLLDRMFSRSARDAQTIADPNCYPYLRAGVDHLLAQGIEGMRSELVTAHGLLTDKLAQVDLPIHWLLPGDIDDRFDEDCAELLQINPDIRFERVENAGELMIYQRQRFFAERIADFAQLVSSS